MEAAILKTLNTVIVSETFVFKFYSGNVKFYLPKQVIMYMVKVKVKLSCYGVP
jgi:hypothetical protein